MSFQNIIFSIGIPAIVVALIYIGRKLQVLDDMQRTIEKIKINLKIMSNFLIQNHKNFDSSELESYSPLQLIKNGIHFVEKIGFTQIFLEHKGDFFAFIDGENPKFKYDVETASIRSIYALHDKEYMAFLKKYLYNNPARNLGNVAPTLGIYVREKYLASHPEIIG